MKNECNIIRDILPLYAEKMVSDDTAAFVQEHLEGCPACRDELNKMRESVRPEPDIDAEPLKRLKKEMKIKKVQTILCTAAVLMALVLSGIAFLTAPEYFDYSPDIVTVTDGENGSAVISFSNRITNYNLQKIKDPEEKKTVYHLEAWTSVWDRIFSKPGARDVSVEPEDGSELLVFFTQYIDYGPDENSVCIYGGSDSDSGGWVALPGLSLYYLLLINAILFAALGIAWLLLRKKERARRWVERLVLIPAAYALGYVCVLRFRTVSYAEMRDFRMILAIGVLFYCAMLLAVHLYHGRKSAQ